jgi:hypothetical protein
MPSMTVAIKMVALAGAAALAGHLMVSRWQRERPEADRALGTREVAPLDPPGRTGSTAPRGTATAGAEAGETVALSTLQEAQANGGDALSIAVMEGRHAVSKRVVQLVSACMARSRSAAVAVLRFTVEIRAVERDVDFFLRPPDILRGELEDDDLQCVAREVTGAHRLRNRLSVGEAPLSGDEQYTVTFRSRSGPGSKVCDSPPK